MKIDNISNQVCFYYYNEDNDSDEPIYVSIDELDFAKEEILKEKTTTLIKDKIQNERNKILSQTIINDSDIKRNEKILDILNNLEKELLKEV